MPGELVHDPFRRVPRDTKRVFRVRARRSLDLGPRGQYGPGQYVALPSGYGPEYSHVVEEVGPYEAASIDAQQASAGRAAPGDYDRVLVDIRSTPAVIYGAIDRYGHLRHFPAGHELPRVRVSSPEGDVVGVNVGETTRIRTASGEPIAGNQGDGDGAGDEAPSPADELAELAGAKGRGAPAKRQVAQVALELLGIDDPADAAAMDPESVAEALEAARSQEEEEAAPQG